MATKGVDLNAVAIFAKVAELGSFRAAAEALRIPKSTVSFKVVQLEEHLGIRLLERTTRTVRLTDAGDDYCHRASAALDTLREAEHELSKLHVAPTGRLRITAPFEFGQRHLQSLIVDYARRHPSVSLQIEFTDRQVNLIEEGFDVAVRPGPLADSALVARHLGKRQPLRLFASSAYLVRRGAPKRPQDLIHHDCLVMSGHRSPTTWTFRSGKRDLIVRVRPRHSVNSFPLLRELAVAGHGIVRLPSAPPSLRAVLDEYRPPPVYWYAIHASAKRMRASLRVFLEMLQNRFETLQGGARSG